MAIEHSALTDTQDLIGRIGRVQEGKAFGLDERGELVGEALKSSFKGKVVDLLVRAGIAKEGSLGGRLAAAFVGKDDFRLILEGRRKTGGDRNPDAFEQNAVRNALEVFERIQLRAAGNDHVKQEAVRETVGSLKDSAHSLRELTWSPDPKGNKLADVFQSLHTKVLPQRDAQRQEVIDRVANGELTEAMRRASPEERLAAMRQIDGKGSDDAATTGATDIVNEFHRSAALIRARVGPDEDASAKVGLFRNDYVRTIASSLAPDALDAADRQGTTQGILGFVRRNLETVEGTNNLSEARPILEELAEIVLRLIKAPDTAPGQKAEAAELAGRVFDKQQQAANEAGGAETSERSASAVGNAADRAELRDTTQQMLEIAHRNFESVEFINENINDPSKTKPILEFIAQSMVGVMAAPDMETGQKAEAARLAARVFSAL